MTVHFEPKPPARVAHPAGRGKHQTIALWCSYCGHRIFRNNEKPDPKISRQHQATHDHILPKHAITPEIAAWLYADFAGFDRIINLRWSCALCNGDRASVGHCPGALAAARSFKGGLVLLRQGKDVKPAPVKPKVLAPPPGSDVVTTRGKIMVYRANETITPKDLTRVEPDHKALRIERDRIALHVAYAVVLSFALGIAVGSSLAHW